MYRTLRLIFAGCLLTAAFTPAWADKVIMKDGTVYQGKILIDSDKAILIGNPPFDPTDYLLETKDIATIVYEQYHPSPPAVRKRGLVAETQLTGNVFSSSDLSLHPAPGLVAGLGFRVHPFFEIDGSVQWLPAVTSSDGLTVSNPTTTRGYQSFWLYSGEVAGRFYPFFYKQKWTWEPYFTTGYGWSHLIPKDSGDSLSGAGWLMGIGFIHPLTEHLFLEGRWTYQAFSFDTINFLGQQGSLNPSVREHLFSFSTGISYRL